MYQLHLCLTEPESVTAAATENGTQSSKGPKCDALGWKCLPIIVDSFGAWRDRVLRPSF